MPAQGTAPVLAPVPEVATARPVKAETPYCKNCGAPLAGAFCADCSQRADVHMPTTLELIHEALEGITHSDSRLWTTLRYLLFKPGKLTQEFIAGRRMAYLPPFRLYLVMSVLFFLLASIWPHDVVRIMDTNEEGTAAAPSQQSAKSRCSNLQSDIFEAQIKRACENIVRDGGEPFKHQVMSVAPKAMFIFLPLIAFFHMLMYWWPRHRYAEHLLFFVHVHAFAFLAMSLMWALNEISSAYKPANTVCGTLIAAILIYFPVYIVKAMRRVFKRSRFNTLVKATTLFFTYVTVLAFTLAAVVLYAAIGM